METDLDLEQTVDAVRRFADTTPVTRSAPSDPRGASAALWRQTPRLRLFDGHRRRFLAVSMRGDSSIEQIIDGRSAWRGPVRGTSVLLEPGFECDWRFTGNFEMLQIYLGADFDLAGLKGDALTTPFRDPVLFQFATTIAMILREGSSAAPALPALLDSVEQYLRAKFRVAPDPAAAASTDRAPGLAPAVRRRVEAFVRAELARDIRVDEMAEIAGLSAGHFGRAFRQSFGVSPYQYVLAQRLARAQELLVSSERPIGEIAAACGFGGASQFGAQFQRAVGCSPRAYRQAG